MAQILITHLVEIHQYSPIASIKQYNEPDFADKLERYGNSVFKHYHVFKFKYPLTCDAIPGKPFEPDLLLVSKDFKKWVIIEVELCKAPTQHTLDQITCFSKPKFILQDVVDYIIKQYPKFKSNEADLLNCLSNPSDLIVVVDDYSDSVFKKFYDFDKQLKICVLEVYKRTDKVYAHEGYRFGGDYPYELTNSSMLEYIDNQHYRIIKKDFLKDLPDTFEVKFDMEPLPAVKFRHTQRTTYLKLPEHNIPADIYLQLGKNLDGEYILQKL